MANHKWSQLANYLRHKSLEICMENHCAEDNHNCDSYAYIDEKGNLLDICMPDYFQGHSARYAGIPLPYSDNGKDLKEAVEDQLWDN